MKKLVEFSPLIITAVILALLLGSFSAGVFDAPKKMEITSSTLIEIVETAKLSTANFIQHGIAKSIIVGKDDCLILYYATVRPNIDFSEIDFKIDPNAKTVTVVLPEKLEFDVDLIQDENHKFHYYPNANDRTLKEIEYICKKDAKEKAEANTALLTAAHESLSNTLTALLEPLLNANEYTLVID